MGGRLRWAAAVTVAAGVTIAVAIDVCPDPSRENLRELATVLRGLEHDATRPLSLFPGASSQLGRHAHT